MTDDFIRPVLKSLDHYIPGKQEEEVKKEFGLTTVIKLASNENPFGPSPKAIEAVSNSIRSASVYPDQHHTILREALAKKLNIDKENLIIGNGSDEIMLLIAQAFLSSQDEAVISKHTFSVYEFVTKVMDGKPVYADLKEHVYDLDAMESKVSAKTKLVFICNPNNPTGTYVDKDKLEKFISRMPMDTIVVIDEAYGNYSTEKDYPKSIEFIHKYPNVIVLQTFSKIFGLAGLRVGYGISNPRIIKYLNLVKLPFNVNRIGQVAAVAALSDDEFVEKSIKNNEQGKEYLYKELSALGLTYLRTQANFICINFDEDSDRIFLGLMKEGVIVRPLSSFDLPQSIRVTVGTPEQNEKFISALKKVL